jgi:hypothetical protein
VAALSVNNVLHNKIGWAMRDEICAPVIAIFIPLVPRIRRIGGSVHFYVRTLSDIRIDGTQRQDSTYKKPDRRSGERETRNTTNDHRSTE